MKREGRQHGMVRTYRVLPTPLNTRPANRRSFDSPTTAGLFARVSTRPTNHSKFTGKCGQPRCNCCHSCPSSKAKDKVKGNHKIKSCDVVSNHRLLTWRVVDARPGFNFSGSSSSSATRILDHLSSYGDDDGYDDDDHDGGYDEDEEEEEEDPTVEIELINDDGHHGDDDNEEMSYCDVGFVLEQVEGDDGWCLVGEM